MSCSVFKSQLNYYLLLQELRAKRETEFETMRGNICDLYEKLELEPRNTTERHLICDSIDNIALSQDTMDNVQLILTRLETETLTNNDVAREIIDQIRSISEKLKMPCDLASMQHDFYSSRMITKVNYLFPIILVLVIHFDFS